MFENIKKTLVEFEKSIDFLKDGNFNEDNKEDVEKFINAENTIDYFELHLAESLMKDKYIDAKKLAKIILAIKGENNE